MRGAQVEGAAGGLGGEAMAENSGGACAASEGGILAAFAPANIEAHIEHIEREIPSRLAALPEGEARWMLEAQLVRARNRRAGVLEDCRCDVAATLNRLC
jgi:hypothetical protein